MIKSKGADQVYNKEAMYFHTGQSVLEYNNSTRTLEIPTLVLLTMYTLHPTGPQELVHFPFSSTQLQHDKILIHGCPPKSNIVLIYFCFTNHKNLPFENFPLADSGMPT